MAVKPVACDCEKGHLELVCNYEDRLIGRSKKLKKELKKLLRGRREDD